MGEVLTAADFTSLRTFLVARNVQRLPTVVRLRVALRAERDQILFRIVAGVAAKPFVVNFQIRHRATRLAPPVISAQYLLPQVFVQLGSEPEARTLR